MLKLKIIKIIIVVVSLFVIAGLTYSYHHKKANIPISPLSINQQEAQTQKNNEIDIVSDFLNSSFRVVLVLVNPFLKNNSLVIATERSDGLPDVATCGSIYVSKNCYFFIEPNFSTISSRPHFIGKWTGGLDKLVIGSVKFKDSNNIQFISSGGDAGDSIDVLWNLDLNTGQITEISRKEY